MATMDNRKHERRTIAVIAIALGAAVLQQAVAQGPKGLTVDVGDCVALEKPEERLACFEAQVEAARERPPAARASEATGPSTDAAERARSSTDAAEPLGASTAPAVHSQTSASEPRSAENGGGAERGSERQPVEIVAKVAELRETVPNAFVITLDNGQVWRQAHPMPYPLRPGLVVRLRETKFGYRLTAPELHGQIQVERVR
jgi:hypothetical protein